MGKVRLGKNAVILLYLLIILVAGSWSLSQSLNISGIDERIKSAGIDTEHFAQLSEETQSQFRTEKGIPYIYLFDPYYFLALAEKGEHNWNSWVLLEYLWIGFDKDSVFFLPLIFGLLTLVIFFFIAKHLTKSDEAAFFSGFILSLHPFFFRATAAGINDTQSINLVFASLFFLLMMKSVDDWRTGKAKLYALLAIIVFFLFALTWKGAVFAPGIVALSAFLLLAINFCRAKQWKSLAVLAIIAVITAWLATLNDTGIKAWRVLIGYSTVFSKHIGEVQGGDIFQLVLIMGGWTVFLLSLFAAAIVLYKNLNKPRFSWLIMLVWFAIMTFATFQRMRFAYYAIIPASLFAGLALHKISQTVSVKTGKKSAIVAIAILIGILLVPSLIDGQRSLIPVMNDAVMEMGKLIDENTAPETRIISWWDYGHFWNYAAKREPYLDGKHKGVGDLWWPRLWATARGFLSDNPEEAAMFWRLLMCTSREELREYVKEPKKISCDANSIIMIDENMIDTAGTMIDVITAFDDRFETGDVNLIDVEQCERNNGQVICSSFTADLDTLTTNTGLPVHQFAQGVRLVSEQTGENVAVLYESQGDWYGFKTTSWLAETMMIRLFAGEHLFSPFATSDYPLRLAAYRFDVSEE